MREQRGSRKKIKLIPTLLVGLTLILALGCATKKPCLSQVPIPPKPQIQITAESKDKFVLSRADLVKLEEYILALERAVK